MYFGETEKEIYSGSHRTKLDYVVFHWRSNYSGKMHLVYQKESPLPFNRRKLWHQKVFRTKYEELGFPLHLESLGKTGTLLLFYHRAFSENSILRKIMRPDTLLKESNNVFISIIEEINLSEVKYSSDVSQRQRMQKQKLPSITEQFCSSYLHIKRFLTHRLGSHSSSYLQLKQRPLPTKKMTAAIHIMMTIVNDGHFMLRKSPSYTVV